MTAVTPALYIAIGFVFGCIWATILVKRIIVHYINRADICSDDKRFIRGVLGIPQNGERQ